MNVCLTDEIQRFSEQFDGYEQSGVTISGRGVETIRAQINSLLALAGELEEDYSRTEWQRRAERDVTANAGGNVVTFRPRGGAA